MFDLASRVSFHQCNFLFVAEIENNVKRTLKLAKGINNGNKDGNLTKKSELIHLIEDFHQQYDSLYSFYEDLRAEVKNNVSFRDDGSPTSFSASDSDSFYSPMTTNIKNSENSPRAIDAEDTTILKDKYTCSSEVKETSAFGPQSHELNETLKELTIEEEKMRDIANLKSELSTLSTQKRVLEDQAESKLNEAMQMQEKVSRLEARILAQEDNEKSLVEQVDSLKQELISLNSHKAELEAELELELKKKSSEAEKGGEVKVISEVKVKDEARSLSSEKTELDEQIMRSEVEKRELRRRISELEASLSKKETELSAQERKFKVIQNELSAQIESLNENLKNRRNKLEELHRERNRLQVEMGALRSETERYKTELEKEKRDSLISKSQMEKKNTELTNKIKDQQKTLLELGDAITKTRIEIPKPNLALVERKVDEMAEEFRKQFEDKYRILSRRIRVAEQLQVENKEWYLKTKDDHERETRELKERFQEVKELSITSNNALVSLDSLALKFEECTANFLNRISKASCELKFAKDWAMRKNKALLQVKYDSDCLLTQLDDKEAEILMYREKVWKCENKVRELEKMVKQREDGMLGLQEEKREAIRQLCVWIDYHRSRSDYYKKMLCEINTGRRMASLERVVLEKFLMD